MTHQVVSRNFCLDYVGEYSDRKEIRIPLSIRDLVLSEASLLMFTFLTKGQAVCTIPRTQLEDAASIALDDAMGLCAFA